jgi:hypothetical protein
LTLVSLPGGGADTADKFFFALTVSILATNTDHPILLANLCTTLRFATKIIMMKNPYRQGLQDVRKMSYSGRKFALKLN